MPSPPGVNPGGGVPLVLAHMYGGVPFCAANVYEYVWPIVPAGSVGFDVIVSPAPIVKLKDWVAVCCGLP